VDCRDVQSLLHPYSDGELDLVRLLQVEHHLAECADCAGRQRGLRELREAIASAALYHRAPAALREKLRPAPVPSAAPARRRPPAWLTATAAGVAVLVTGVLFWRSGPVAEDRLADQVVAGHVRSLQLAHLTDVVSSDRHTVKPWFRGKVDFSPPVPDLSAHGYALTGGRLDYLVDRPVAALVYHRRLHAINLFIWPVSDDAGRAVRSLHRQGFNIRHWRRSGMVYWAISDLNAAEFDEFVRLVHEHLTAPLP
jgi:anti-sigma factor RsiW